MKILYRKNKDGKEKRNGVNCDVKAVNFFELDKHLNSGWSEKAPSKERKAKENDS